MAWDPSVTDYHDVWDDQNPWLREGVVPAEWAKPVERPLAKVLWRRVLANEPARYQLILGPRRVGKSTVMYQTVQRLLAERLPPSLLRWMRLDHPLLMRFTLGDWVRALTSKLPTGMVLYLFLDELTQARDWDLWLKTFYDENWPVRVLGTSSATAAIRNRTLESGIGRWEEQYLPPYSFYEFLELIGRKPEVPVQETLAQTLLESIQAPPALAGLAEARSRFAVIGGFPELLTLDTRPDKPDNRTALLQSQRILQSDAVERTIYKDIPQAFGVENPMMLERLLYTLAGQITGLLSPQNLCQNLDGMSKPTFDKYLSYLERAFLLFTLPNYSGSELAIQKRGRKLYFVDGAVRNAALLRGTRVLEDPRRWGFSWKTWPRATCTPPARSRRSGCIIGGRASRRWTWSTIIPNAPWPSRSAVLQTTPVPHWRLSVRGFPGSSTAVTWSHLRSPQRPRLRTASGDLPWTTC